MNRCKRVFISRGRLYEAVEVSPPWSEFRYEVDVRYPLLDADGSPSTLTYKGEAVLNEYGEIVIGDPVTCANLIFLRRAPWDAEVQADHALVDECRRLIARALLGTRRPPRLGGEALIAWNAAKSFLKQKSSPTG